MEIFPHLQLGLINGWIFLPFIYISTEGVAKRLPKDISKRLFDHGNWTRKDENIALLAGMPTLVYFILLIFTPLKVGSWLLFIGISLFIFGAVTCVHSIMMFAKTPEGQPVTSGLYKYSRNPQTVGMVIAIIGASIAIGSWIALGVVLVWVLFLHIRVLAEEKTCLVKHGESYRRYMDHVPRYIII